MSGSRLCSRKQTIFPACPMDSLASWLPFPSVTMAGRRFADSRINDGEEFSLIHSFYRPVTGLPQRPKECKPGVPVRTDKRRPLTGLLSCGDGGSRLCYNHITTRRKLADGTRRVYERDLSRCFRKISLRQSCSGGAFLSLVLWYPVGAETELHH